MAAGEGYNAMAPWDELPAIDRVSEDYVPLRDLKPARRSSIHCLAYWSRRDESVLLMHEQGNNTYLRGSCHRFGLTETCQEREVEELRGRRVVQVAFSLWGNAYILTEDGILWSSGDASCGHLGLPHIQVAPDCFGPVLIDQVVRRVAAGGQHVLAMTEDQVFAFSSNGYGRLGVLGCDSSPDPRAVYAGSGPAAPHQVACGAWDSVILTVGGKVLTCGEGGRTGQGHDNNVSKMSEVRGLRDKHVQEVASTWWSTYALSDGNLYGWGENGDGRLGVGHESGGRGFILKPIPISCGGHHIITFRCAGNLVLAVIDNGDCLFWGRDKDTRVIMSPQLLTGHPFPRDVCGRGPASGGLVFLDSKENYQRVFPVLSGTIRVVEDSRLEQGVKIGELHRRTAAMQLAQDADVGQPTQQQNVHQQRTDSDAKIAELETENPELRLQKSEMLAQFRSGTVDYRELQMEYSEHLESCGINPMRGSFRQSQRGRDERRGPVDPTGARQERY